MRQCPFILWRHKESFAAISDHTGITFNIGGNNSCPSGHRFEENNTEALLTSRRGAENVGGVVLARQVLIGDKAFKEHISQAFDIGVPLVFLLQAAVRSNDDQAGVRKLLLDYRESFQ